MAESAHKASEILKVTSLSLHDFPDNRMDSVDLLDVVKVIEKHINRIQPELIYTHHAGDLNIDHRITHEAVITTCRPMPGQSLKTLLFFEVPSSTEVRISGIFPHFAPNWFVDVSNTIDLKLEALKIYHSEMRPWPHSRSIEAVEFLARWRGASVGIEAAEAFMVGRIIIRSEVAL